MKSTAIWTIEWSWITDLHFIRYSWFESKFYVFPTYMNTFSIHLHWLQTSCQPRLQGFHAFNLHLVFHKFFENRFFSKQRTSAKFINFQFPQLATFETYYNILKSIPQFLSVMIAWIFLNNKFIITLIIKYPVKTQRSRIATQFVRVTRHWRSPFFFHEDWECVGRLVPRDLFYLVILVLPEKGPKLSQSSVRTANQ